MTIESLLQLFNHCGTFAFATSGVRLTEHLNRQQKNLLTAFLSAFGGGLTRDLILLHRKPALFDSQVDILITLLVFLLYVVLQRFQVIQFLDSRPIKMLLLLFDAAGTSVFICAGVEAAISCNTGTGVILLSGVLTAIGGGIWAAFVAGQSPKTILQNAIGYRVIVLCHSAAYTFGHLIFQKNTEILDISLVAVCTTCCYIRYRILENTVQNQQKSLQQNHWYTSKKILFLQSRSQLFWSVVNPVQGARTYRVFRSPRGKRIVICSTGP